MPTENSAPLSLKMKLVTLYALGSNGNFQLGLPHNQDTNYPQKCIFNVPVVQLLSANQSTSSCNDPAPPMPTQTHIPLQPTETIKTITAGGNHTLLLTTHGRVFAAGSNEHGQLALHHPIPSYAYEVARDTSYTASPTPTNSTAPPGFHLLLWTGDTPLVSRVSITHIAATFTATHLVANHTYLFTAGYGPKGELALGPSSTSCSTPRLAFDIRDVEGPDARVESMTGCMDHVLILSSSGIVYGFGAARKGQLGEVLAQEKGGICWKVTATDMALELPFRVSQIATGRDFSVVAGRRAGEVKAFGKGSAEFHANFNSSPRSAPSSKVENGNNESQSETGACARDGDTSAEAELVTLHAGWSSLTFHHEISSTSYLSGCFATSPATSASSSTTNSQPVSTRQAKFHDRGQLPPPNLPTITSLAVGSEHTVALLGDGSVVSWGWGEHGNCGRDIDERGIVGGGRWNVLFEGGGEGGKGRVVGVGAGCGSSFFWIEEEEEEEEEERGGAGIWIEQE